MIHFARGGSSVDRWATCPASIRMSEGIEDTPSKFAEEGTRAHDALEASQKLGDLQIDLCDDEEMEHAVLMCLDAIEAERALFATIEHDEPETFVLPIPAREDVGGSADHIIAGTTHDGVRKISVIDFKYGKHYKVKADSSQLAFYALGAAALVGGVFQEFTATIVQPRQVIGKDYVRSHTRNHAEMFEFWRWLNAAVKATDDPNARPVYSAQGCMWCRAKGVCDAYAARPRKHARTDDQDFADLLS